MRLGFALLDEYYYRFGEGKHQRAKRILEYFNIPKNIPQFERGSLTSFALAIPDKYKNKNTVQSYRAYYLGEKSHLFKWTKREKPGWIK